MCYRSTESVETNAEDMEVTAHEKPGRYGERSHNQHRESTSEPIHAGADTQSVIGRIKALFTG